MLTAIRDLDLHSQAVRRGALGLVQKGASADVLVRAIYKVHGGEAWFDRTLMGRALVELTRARDVTPEAPAAAQLASLTKREREIIRLVGEALKNKAIAERLRISEATVRHHLTSIYEKLGVSDRLELVVYAYRYKLAEPPE